MSQTVCGRGKDGRVESSHASGPLPSVASPTGEFHEVPEFASVAYDAVRRDFGVPGEAVKRRPDDFTIGYRALAGRTDLRIRS